MSGGEREGRTRQRIEMVIVETPADEQGSGLERSGSCIVVLGDCLDVMDKSVGPASVDLIFADPPYNLSGRSLRSRGSVTGGDWYKMDSAWDRMSAGDYVRFTRAWIAASARLLRPGGSIFVSCTYHNLGEVLVTLKSEGLGINNLITWYKSNAMPNLTRRTFTHACEYIVWAAKGSGWVFDYELMKSLNPDRRKDGKKKQMRDLWVFPLCQGGERLRRDDGRALHPTQKPEALVERVVLAASRSGDLVLDPFMGSGTTGVVAVRNGRRFIGVEREREYFHASVERLERLIEKSRRR